ncbi:MAG: UbiA family prenyltransferase [Coriobacteriia bacterium]
MNVAKLILMSARPRQWTKNLIVFAPAIFGEALLLPGNVARLAALFALLCVASGAAYLINDLVDREADRAYERTSGRPLASGALPISPAIASAVLMAVVAVAGAYALDFITGHVLLVYLLVQASYTFGLKRVVVLDALIIAVGFTVRAVAGATVIQIDSSEWLLACAALLVLFLATAKRRQELVELGEAAPAHRAVLKSYTVPMLDVMLAALAAAVGLSYLLYTLLGSGRSHGGMVLTVPFVLYGLFRYLTLSYSNEPTGTAEEILLTDTPLIVAVVSWLATALVLIYVV